MPLQPVNDERAATLLTLEGHDGPIHWMTFQNFYVISRYNRSARYSMAVWELSNAISEGSKRSR